MVREVRAKKPKCKSLGEKRRKKKGEEEKNRRIREPESGDRNRGVKPKKGKGRGDPGTALCRKRINCGKKQKRKVLQD